MAKTRDEIIRMAHRRLGVLAADEAPTADQHAYASAVLDGLVAELEGAQGIALSWDGTQADDGLFLPLAYLLAVDIGPHYDVPPRDSRAQLIGRIRAFEITDDREVRADLDDDGTVTDSEAYVDGQAAYY
jgi:hypothetical protein